MTKLEQAARQALEAIGDCSPNKALVKAAYALREALAGVNMSPTEQTEQEPEAWLIGDKVFRTLTEAENYRTMFTHHIIEPLFK